MQTDDLNDQQYLKNLANLIFQEKTDLEDASDILSWLGQVDHPQSYLERRHLLEQCLLRCRSAIIRYGAVLGLFYMDDPASIKVVRQAVVSEKIKSLQQDELQLLKQLETSRN